MAANTGDILSRKILAEVLRLQRWAAGNGTLSAARIFGLVRGFESVVDEEQSDGISRETQEKIEDLLQDVDDGKQAVDGQAIKSRLRTIGVSDSVANDVMKLCCLQGRFADTV
jgi:hypothetical protein